MVESWGIKELYDEWIEDDLDWIRLINEENKILQSVREIRSDKPETVMKCRELLFDNAKFVNVLTRRIENVRDEIKKLS
jgi:hypothetical protein